MSREPTLPDALLRSISRVVEQACADMFAAWAANSNKEDGISAATFIPFHKPRTVLCTLPSGENARYKWSFNPCVFSSAGSDPTEKAIGADMIFTFRAKSKTQELQKSFLFQAKKKGNRVGLTDQIERLLAWPDAAGIIEYNAGKAIVVTVRDYQLMGESAFSKAGMTLLDFIKHKFVPCHLGDRDLEWDRAKGFLAWKDSAGTYVKLRAKDLTLMEAVSEDPAVLKKLKADGWVPNKTSKFTTAKMIASDLDEIRLHSTDPVFKIVGNRNPAAPSKNSKADGPDEDKPQEPMGFSA